MCFPSILIKIHSADDAIDDKHDTDHCNCDEVHYDDETICFAPLMTQFTDYDTLCANCYMIQCNQDTIHADYEASHDNQVSVMIHSN